MIQPEGEHLFTPCCSPGDSWACANRSESPEISFSSMEQGWFYRESAFDPSGWDLGSSHEGSPPTPGCRLVRQAVLAGDSAAFSSHGQEMLHPGTSFRAGGKVLESHLASSPWCWLRLGVAGRVSAAGCRQGCSRRAPGAELVTRVWPVMHVLLTHVGMSQSPGGRGLTQQQAERRREMGLRCRWR